MESLTQIALRELDSEVCAVCKGPKKKRQSFCRDCYFRLPLNLRSRLYRMMSEGYVEAYDEAKDWLKINTEKGEAP